MLRTAHVLHLAGKYVSVLASGTLFMLDVVAVSTKALTWEGNDGIQRRLHDKDNNDVGSKGVFLSHHHSIVT